MLKNETAAFLLFPFWSVLLIAGCNGPSSRLTSAIEDEDATRIEQLAKSDKEQLSAFPFRGESALLIAMHSSKKKAFEALLKNGADPNRIGPNHQCLMLAAAKANDPYWLTEALRYGGDPNIDNMASASRRGTPLTVAAGNNKLENVKLLVQAGADVNLVCNDEDALVCAMQSNSFDVVMFLLENQADFRRKVGRYNSFAMWIKGKNADLFLLEEDKNGINRVWKWLNEHGATVENIVHNGEGWHW